MTMYRQNCSLAGKEKGPASLVYCRLEIPCKTAQTKGSLSPQNSGKECEGVSIHDHDCAVTIILPDFGGMKEWGRVGHIQEN